MSTKYLNKYNWSLNWLYTWFLLILKKQCLTGFWVDTNGAGFLTLLWQMVSLALIVSVSAIRAFVLFNLCVCNRSFDQTRPTTLEARTIVRLIRPDLPHSRREQSFVWSDETYRTRGEKANHYTLIHVFTRDSFCFFPYSFNIFSLHFITLCRSKITSAMLIFSTNYGLRGLFL